MNKIDVVWDMETGDPDDYLTLLLLLDHPQIKLKAVTITPGSPDQIGLVRHVLSLFNKEIPVGSFNLSHEKKCVSDWYYNVIGNFDESFQAEKGYEVLLKHLDKNTTLITGAPLKNLGVAIKESKRKNILFEIGKWYAQGGFAGEGVVPTDLQLEKFKNKVTCATYNLGGDPNSALLALDYDGFGIRKFVSKNVCHGVYYDQIFHDKLYPHRNDRLSLSLIYKAMEIYLSKHREGKKFHDPLAACCAINDKIGSWEEVELYLEKGKWGSRLRKGSKTWIIVDYNKELLFQTLIGKYEW